jgi:hypothetical protein
MYLKQPPFFSFAFYKKIALTIGTRFQRPVNSMKQIYDPRRSGAIVFFPHQALGARH